MNETRKSSSSANNEKRITDTPVEETGAKMLTAGLEIDNFDNSTYSMMFLNNAIKNEETNADHRSDTNSISSTSHEHTLSQAKGAINQHWVLIDNRSTVHLI